MLPMSNTPSGPTFRLSGLIEVNHGTFRGAVRACLGQVALALGQTDRFGPHPGQEVRRLVFVCLGNINRSAFAEVVARREGASCASLGLSTTTGAPATPQACSQARRQGFSLEEHRATNWTDYQREEGDLLLAMELRHADRLIGLGIPPHAIGLLGLWARPLRVHLHDPHTLSDAYFSTCFALIESAVRRLVADCPQVRSTV